MSDKGQKVNIDHVSHGEITFNNVIDVITEDGFLKLYKNDVLDIFPAEKIESCTVHKKQ